MPVKDRTGLEKWMCLQVQLPGNGSNSHRLSYALPGADPPVTMSDAEGPGTGDSPAATPNGLDGEFLAEQGQQSCAPVTQLCKESHRSRGEGTLLFQLSDPIYIYIGFTVDALHQTLYMYLEAFGSLLSGASRAVKILFADVSFPS